MNHPFIKMLQFEWKSNYMMWVYNLIIGAGLLTLLYFQGGMNNSFLPIFVFPIFALITWIFTINSYQESAKKQSMQMYHLIPVSKNTKFFSKQFITLIAFPVVFAITASIFIRIIKIFTDTPEVLHESGSTNPTEQYLLLIWLFGHSVSTFFAVMFRKNKLLYAILVYFCVQMAMSILFITIFVGFAKNNGFHFLPSLTDQDVKTWSTVGALFLTAVFYGISYHQFFRRQL